jgi:hypothetical protein
MVDYKLVGSGIESRLSLSAQCGAVDSASTSSSQLDTVTAPQLIAQMM